MPPSVGERCGITLIIDKIELSSGRTIEKELNQRANPNIIVSPAVLIGSPIIDKLCISRDARVGDKSLRTMKEDAVTVLETVNEGLISEPVKEHGRHQVQYPRKTLLFFD
jgi:hypothetical protein